MRPGEVFRPSKTVRFVTKEPEINVVKLYFRNGRTAIVKYRGIKDYTRQVKALHQRYGYPVREEGM